MPFSPFVLAKNLPRRRSLHLASAQYRAMQASSSLDFDILPSQQTDTSGIQLLRNQRDPQNQVCKCAHAQALPRGAAAFCGTWQVEASDDHEIFLHMLGVPYIMRKAFARLRPEPTFSIVDGRLVGVTLGVADDFATGTGERSVSFAGRPALVEYSWEGDSESPELVARARVPGGQPFVIRRRIDEQGQLVATSEMDGGSFTRIYRRAGSARSSQ